MLKLLLVSLICFLTTTKACGCYGPTSCDLNSNRVICGIDGVCDCCPTCNTCHQLFAGCASKDTIYDGYFEPILPQYFIFDQKIDNYFIKNSFIHFPDRFCILQNLPIGLSFHTNINGQLYLSGTPNEIWPPTLYQIKIKGPVNIISAMNFTLSVVKTNC